MNIIDKQILYEAFAKQYQSRLLNEAANARLGRQLRANRRQYKPKEQSRARFEQMLKNNPIVNGLAILVKSLKSESRKEICS
jgi:hypothetical protein